MDLNDMSAPPRATASDEQAGGRNDARIFPRYARSEVKRIEAIDSDDRLFAERHWLIGAKEVLG